MKINYLLWDFGLTGGSQVIYNFMDGMIKNGHTITVTTPYLSLPWTLGTKEIILSKQDKLVHLKKLSNMKFVSYKLKKKLFGAGDSETDDIFQLVRLILRNWKAADVSVATYCFTALATPELGERSVPMYHMQHFEPLFFTRPSQIALSQSTYALPLINLANSSWLKTVVKEKFNRISDIVHPGIDLDLFNYKLKEPLYSGRPFRVLTYCDTNREWKGFEDALKAMQLVGGYLGSRVQWLLFGTVGKVALNKASQFLDTTYVGRKYGRDLVELYQIADVVLCPSWYESFPLPPLEAMATGTPVVTTRVGTEDFALHDQTAFVVEPRDIVAMSEYIITLYERDSKREQIGRSGREMAQRYDWSSRQDIYSEVVENNFKNYSFSPISSEGFFAINPIIQKKVTI